MIQRMLSLSAMLIVGLLLTGFNAGLRAQSPPPGSQEIGNPPPTGTTPDSAPPSGITPDNPPSGAVPDDPPPSEAPPGNPPPAVNVAPVLTVPGAQTVNEGATLTFTVTATDTDEGQVVKFSAANLPIGATFDTNTGVFSWTPLFTQAGSYTVNFTATDNGAPALSDGPRSVTITVSDAVQPSTLVDGFVGDPPNQQPAGGWFTTTNTGLFHLYFVSGATSNGPVLNPSGPVNIPLPDGSYTFSLLANAGDTGPNQRMILTFNDGTNTGSIDVTLTSPAGSVVLGGKTIRVTSFTWLNGGQPNLVGNTSPTPDGYSDCRGLVTLEVYVNHPPVANSGADQAVECTGPSGASGILNGSGSSDPDGDTLTYTWTGPFGTATGATPTVPLSLGAHTITLTVSDGKGGTAMDQVVVTVVDTKPPTLAGVPADATVECDSVPAAATVTATDACDPAPTVTLVETRTDGSSPDNYTLKRTWTAKDRSNNSASATQTLTVRDTKVPTLTLVGANPVTVECPTLYVDLGVTVTDNCDPNPTLTTQNPVDVHTPGNYTITYTAKDRSGNTATLTRTVKVQDTTPPQITFALSLTELWPVDHKMYKVASVSVADACDHSPAVTISVTSNEAINGKGDGNTLPDYTVVNNGNGTYDVFARAERSGKLTGRIYTITVTAKDASGNVGTNSGGTVSVSHDQSKKAKVALAKVGEGDAGLEAPEALPTTFGVDQNYPNPFNPSTTIRYALPEGSSVSLVIYNILGQQVRTLVSGSQGAGYHTVVWDGRDEAGRTAATGLYLYRLQAGTFSEVRKMLFAK